MISNRRINLKRSLWICFEFARTACAPKWHRIAQRGTKRYRLSATKPQSASTMTPIDVHVTISVIAPAVVEISFLIRINEFVYWHACEGGFRFSSYGNTMMDRVFLPFWIFQRFGHICKWIWLKLFEQLAHFTNFPSAWSQSTKVYLLRRPFCSAKNSKKIGSI